MYAPHPIAPRCWPGAFYTIAALILIGMVVAPGRHVWALDNEAARATLKGLSGVAVWVGDLAPDISQHGLTKQQLQTEVERQMRHAGITVFSSQEAGTSSDTAFVVVSVTTLRHTGGLYMYAVDLAVYQAAALLRDPTPRSLVTWAVGRIGLVEAANLRAISTSVSQQVELFIQTYRTVNPRASPEGGETAASHARLRQVQERLQAAGFAPGPLDGRLGPQTRAALRQYQQRKGLPVTGTLDTQTLQALRVR
jgi:putative peptidoglycan binding protein